MDYKFQFNVNDEKVFEGDIICQECIEINKNGKQCKKTTCIGTPFCWIHLQYIKKLKIKPWTIPNGGRGLFVVDKSAGNNDIIFKKGHTIITYGGELLNSRQLNNRYSKYTAPYAYKIDKDNYRDGALKRGIGSLSNTNSSRNNARLSANTKLKTATLKATKNIRNGNEIFVSYGRQYKFDEPISCRTIYR